MHHWSQHLLPDRRALSHLDLATFQTLAGGGDNNARHPFILGLSVITITIITSRSYLRVDTKKRLDEKGGKSNKIFDLEA